MLNGCGRNWESTTETGSPLNGTDKGSFFDAYCTCDTLSPWGGRIYIDKFMHVYSIHMYNGSIQKCACPSACPCLPPIPSTLLTIFSLSSSSLQCKPSLSYHCTSVSSPPGPSIIMSLAMQLSQSESVIPVFPSPIWMVLPVMHDTPYFPPCATQPFFPSWPQVSLSHAAGGAPMCEDISCKV